jgi:hypothetical protein
VISYLGSTYGLEIHHTSLQIRIDCSRMGRTDVEPTTFLRVVFRMIRNYLGALIQYQSTN